MFKVSNFVRACYHLILKDIESLFSFEEYFEEFLLVSKRFLGFPNLGAENFVWEYKIASFD